MTSYTNARPGVGLLVVDRCVEQRTRRGRLLTAADQIGLRLLLRRRDFIQDVPNVAYICRGTVP